MTETGDPTGLIAAETVAGAGHVAAVAGPAARSEVAAVATAARARCGRMPR